MKMVSVLIVDGDRAARAAVALELRRAGHEVREAASCRGADELLAEKHADLLMLEWALPDMSGLEYVGELRSRANGHAPRVIMVSHRNVVGDIVRALDDGVDDYITKPYQVAELLARVRVALRRSVTLPVSAPLRVGDIDMDRVAHRVMVAGGELSLAPAEYRLLEYLLVNPGRVHSRVQLLQRVWGRDTGIGPRTVDVHVRRLRQVLEPYQLEGMIQTIRGFGYRLQPLSQCSALLD